jgi:hypothetical protein
MLTSENGEEVIRKEIDSLLSTKEETDARMKFILCMELRRDTGLFHSKAQIRIYSSFYSWD